ncbi:MAG: ion channel [Desulfovibrionaceae bacterium]
MITLPAWLRTPFAQLVAAILGLLLAATVGFYFFELRHSEQANVFSALWWSVVTLTTVGYGDIVPQTTGGRLMGILVMISGIGLVSTFTGNLASLLVERKAKKRKGLLEVKLNNHILIVGWNEFAANLVEGLVQDNTHQDSELVLINNLGEEAREELRFSLGLGERLHFVWGNPTQKNVIHKARPQNARVAYLLCHEGLESAEADQQTIYAALALRSLAPKLPLYGEVALPENREHLLRTGVNELFVRGELATRMMGMVGEDPALWAFVQTLLGMRGARLLRFRSLTREEREQNWGEMVARVRAQDQSLPLALCSKGADVSLQDLLDESSALDSFILSLFESSGQETSLGSQGPRVLPNPPDDEALAPYDALLFLQGPGVRK